MMFSSIIRYVSIKSLQTITPCAQQARCSLLLRHDVHSSSATFCSPNETNKNKVKGKAKEEQPVSSEKVMEKMQSPIITLINTDGVQGVMTLAQATRYAKKNNLKLVRHIDVQMESKGKRMVYKLLGNKEFFKDQQPSKQEKKTSSYLKGEKNIEISTKITDQHLDMKLKSVLKWLQQTKQVHVNISGTTNKVAIERVSSTVEEQIKEIGAKIIQVVNRGSNDVRITINPSRPAPSTATRKKDSHGTEKLENSNKTSEDKEGTKNTANSVDDDKL